MTGQTEKFWLSTMRMEDFENERIQFSRLSNGQKISKIRSCQRSLCVRGYCYVAIRWARILIQMCPLIRCLLKVRSGRIRTYCADKGHPFTDYGPIG